MHSSIFLLSAAAALLDSASAHGFVTGVNVKGAWTAGSDPVWYYYPANSRPQTAGWDALNQDIGFVEPASMGTADVNCHKSATAGRLYTNVNAGDTIQFAWSTWPDSHKGPIINYIAPCNGSFPSFLNLSTLLMCSARRLHKPSLKLPPLVQNLTSRHPLHFPNNLGHRCTDQVQLHHFHHDPAQPGARQLRHPARNHCPARRFE